MAESTNTPGAMPETTQEGRDAPTVEREAEESNLEKALKAERKRAEAAERRAKAYEEADKTRADEDLRKRGEFETLEKRLKAEVEAAKQALNERDKRDLLRAAALKYIAPGKAIDDALALVAGEFSLKDGELSRDADEYFAEFVKNRPYFAKAAAASVLKGTSPGGGIGQPDVSKLTPLQKMAMRNKK